MSLQPLEQTICGMLAPGQHTVYTDHKIRSELKTKTGRSIYEVKMSFIKKFKFSEHLTNSTSGCLAVQFLILHSMSLLQQCISCTFIQRREEFLHLVVILSRDNRLGSSYGLSTDELSTPAPFPYIVTVGNLNPPTLSPFSPIFPHL